MESELKVQPLPRMKRRFTFIGLFVVFVLSLPFLFLYATGYEFHLFGSEANIVATGGIYVDVERDGVEVFIDDKLVEEKRVFRRAFYAQNLDVGTHRVHVQKEGHHTWVKELPVSKHLVTEVHAFNLPTVPQVRVIAPFVSATGTAIVTTALPVASTTNELIATTTKSSKKYTKNSEFDSLIEIFATTSTTTALTPQQQVIERVEKLFDATTTASTTGEVPTTTKEWGGVRLSESGEEVYASWVGSRENTPYYYCAAEFPPYSTSSSPAAPEPSETEEGEPVQDSPAFIHPVQTIPNDTDCEPTIKLDRKWQEIRAFDFYPGSTDLVLVSLADGVYVIEIDNRAWQNVQPLIAGEHLTARVLNGQIYVYDGSLIYQVIPEEL